jgi:hypothetical protein
MLRRLAQNDLVPRDLAPGDNGRRGNLGVGLALDKSTSIAELTVWGICQRDFCVTAMLCV